MNRLKLLIIAISAMLLFSCKEKPFTGYVVCKEYTPQHMSYVAAKSIQEATIYIPHVTVVPKRPPHLEKSKWVLYVANKYTVKAISVDSILFINTKLGSKVTFK